MATMSFKKFNEKNVFLYILSIFYNFDGFITVKVKFDEKILVSTEGCKIPASSIINSNIKKFMAQTEISICTQNSHLLDSNSTHIWLVEESLDLYNILNSENDLFCCYRYFYAENNIAQITYGPCEEFTSVKEAGHEFTRVECYHLDVKMYDDFFLFPAFTKVKVSNIRKESLPAFNVLLFGIESMSRMNFLRMMPRTAQFLLEKDSIQLLGYNKVGDNSFPNLFPLLLGKSYEQVKKLCIKNNVINVKRCVFIWTKFKEAGYHTVLASDSIAGLLGTYEYNLPNLPTDFYLQPFVFETRNIFKNKNYNFHQCFRNKYFYELLLTWTTEILENASTRLFGVLWEESISHENFNIPQKVDEDYLNFFKKIEKSHLLDESIVILFSDHGMRWGEISQTKEGRLESRLPLFEVIFPKKFQVEYPLAFKNFKQNKHRLTSPYDIHETLLDILENKLKDDKIKKRSKQITCRTPKVSLFLPISKLRTCKNIRINEHWCTCQTQEISVLDEETKVFVAQFIINYINGILWNYNQCHLLKIQSILNATMTRELNDQIFMYKMVVVTSPGNGIFEGTIRQKHLKLSVSGIISRLNLYRYTSQCIQNNDVKMYCTCK